MITHQRLREILIYQPETGLFIYRISRGGCRKGTIAGTSRKDKYRRLNIEGKTYAHARLAWFYMTGEWPKNQVDHRDLNPANNQWDNLRAATRSENGRNKRNYRNNKTGFKGVFYDQKNRNYRAQIQIENKRIEVGRFETAQLAAEARILMLRPIHGEFARV